MRVVAGESHRGSRQPYDLKIDFWDLSYVLGFWRRGLGQP